MKIERYTAPQSSFLSVEKDLEIIIEKFLSNNRLKKLLYYTIPDALDQPNLTMEQSNSMIGTNIKLVPKVYINKDVLNYIFINFDSFVPNSNNPEFRNNIIEIDIVCHFDQWHLKDYQLRPFRIAAEIDTMLNNKHLTGIGNLLFYGANKVNINHEFCCFCLKYVAVHGGEDKKGMLSPEDQHAFLEDFKEQNKVIFK